MASITVAGLSQQGVPRPIIRNPEHHKKIVVCCDGTWCGDTVRTHGNIKIIAEQFAGQEVHEGRGYGHKVGGKTILVRYYAGVLGSKANGPWIEKVLDGALAVSIRDRCVEAYQFIAKKYARGDKIWLFGLSRGAFTVRCVAGMINNCGIVRGSKLDNEELTVLCNQAYDLYRNKEPENRPNADAAKAFQALYSHPKGDAPPIRFMGLLDTVGALGVPKLDPGRHIQYEFYDTFVSSEVQQVFQALALDDRLAVFTPCHVKPWHRNPKHPRTHYLSVPDSAFIREEVWFPGAHFDVGRQIFALDADVNGDPNEVVLPKFIYTPSLADPPLYAMLDKVREAMRTDHDIVVVPRSDNDLVGKSRLDPSPPFVWRVTELLGVGLLKPYKSAVVAVSDRDPATGMIKTAAKKNAKYQGAYASYLADVSTTINWATWFRVIPLIGLPATIVFSLLDAPLFIATQQFIADREPTVGAHWYANQAPGLTTTSSPEIPPQREATRAPTPGPPTP